MTGETSKAPWDQRLVERMARQAWDAANDPLRGAKRPTLREAIRSPYFWLATGAVVVAFSVLQISEQGWAFALAGALYVFGLLMTAIDRRRWSRRRSQDASS
jgi:hypothetical protein